MSSANTANPSPAPRPDRPNTAIVIGASARACAQSLLRASITPIAIDLFADRDLKQIARTHICPIEAYPQGIPDILRTQLADVPADVPVILTGAMENHIDILREIQSIRPLSCGTVDSLARARSADLLENACKAAGGETLVMQSRLPVDTPAHVLFDQANEWVMKPVKSSAGHGMVRFSPSSGIPTPRPGQDAYFQPWFSSILSTVDISAAFTAWDQDVQLIGITRQIIGDRAFGARYPTQYVGNISPGSLESLLTPVQLGDLLRLGREVVRQSGLHGPFGIDMVGAAGILIDRLHVLEINPRYTSGMEAIELGARARVFAASSQPIGQRTASLAHGKAIVYARTDCTMPDFWLYMSPSLIADVPQPGEQVPAGRPICTVVAQGGTIAECHANLASLAQKVYTLCEP